MRKSRRSADAGRDFGKVENFGKLKWLDAFDAAFAVHGLAWESRNRRTRSFHRIPAALCRGLSRGVRLQARCPAGVFVAFSSNTSELAVDVELEDAVEMPHMPLSGSAGLELFFRREGAWSTLAMAMPRPGETRYRSRLFTDTTAQWRDFRLYLPLYGGVRFLKIGVSAGAEVRAGESGALPIVFYGTSITQGGCASSAGSDFVAILGRMLKREVINFGFSGNGKGEPEVADLVASIDASAFVLDYAANVDADCLAATLPAFVGKLRARRSLVPVILISQPLGNLALLHRQKLWELWRKRDIMMAVYLAAKKELDETLHFIDGLPLIPPGVAGLYVDGTHPTSAGFARMAETLAFQLSLIVSDRNEERIGRVAPMGNFEGEFPARDNAA